VCKRPSFCYSFVPSRHARAGVCMQVLLDKQEGSVTITFECFDGPTVSEELLQECSDLFGGHYGIWGPRGFKPGQPVRQPLNSVKALLKSGDARLAIARSAGQLVAYAAAVQPNVSGNCKVSWVTQLVVHADFRNQGIATRVLFAFWQFSDHFAWGLVTANPFAVRALEKATRRRVQPSRASSSVDVVLQAGRGIPYIMSDTDVLCTDRCSLINTKFFVAHDGVPEMVRQASVDEPWLLGELPEGWEWFAFTFRDQDQIPLAPEELNEMLSSPFQKFAHVFFKLPASTAGSVPSDHACGQSRR